MSKTLTQIAQQLKDANKKVQLIYAFNGTGKTRLSSEFKELIAPRAEHDEKLEENILKVLYYNAFTEDLFYWDNDLEGDIERKLKIHPNKYTDWVLKEQGQDQNTITHFQRYTSNKLTPNFSADFSEVSFSLNLGGDDNFENLKISKGEESNFIWSIFYSLLEEIISIRTENKSDTEETPDNDDDVPYINLEYVFIDDPVSSLDENHLIELAVNLANLLKSSPFVDGSGVKFVVTTHNPLFYNVLYNELNNDLEKVLPDGKSKKIYKRGQSRKYILEKNGNGSFNLKDSNDRPFSYHLFLLSELEKIKVPDDVQKYHFNFLRNVLEKTATFLGCKHWNELIKELPDCADGYMERILNLYSHSAHGGDDGADIKTEDKEKLLKLVKDFTKNYRFNPKE